MFKLILLKGGARYFNKQVLVLTFAMMICMLSLSFVMADKECNGLNCPTNVTITIGNSPTQIISITPPSSITLNGMGTQVVSIQFVAEDANGNSDIDSSKASVNLKLGSESRNSSSCINTITTTYRKTFVCNVTMQFYDSDGIWTVNASIKDASNGYEYNSTTVIVNSLDYVLQDKSLISWDSVDVNTNDNEASSPLTLINGGNQNYPVISIKGFNATGQSTGQIIPTASFSVSNLTGQTIGQLYMIDNNYVDVSSKLRLNSHGSNVTKNIFFYLDVPNGLMTDTYVQSDSWVIKVSS